jgi:hypothetical protein
MLGAAESPLGDREGGATAIFEKSGPPDSADPADFCNKIGHKATRGWRYGARNRLVIQQSDQPEREMKEKALDR